MCLMIKKIIIKSNLYNYMLELNYLKKLINFNNIFNLSIHTE